MSRVVIEIVDLPEGGVELSASVAPGDVPVPGAFTLAQAYAYEIMRAVDEDRIKPEGLEPVSGPVN